MLTFYGYYAGRLYTLKHRMKLGVDDTKESLLSMVIAEMFNRIGYLFARSYCAFFTRPRIAQYYNTPNRKEEIIKLLELSERNAKMFRMERLKQIEMTNPDKHAETRTNIVKTRFKSGGITVPYRMF